MNAPRKSSVEFFPPSFLNFGSDRVCPYEQLGKIICAITEINVWGLCS